MATTPWMFADEPADVAANGDAKTAAPKSAHDATPTMRVGDGLVVEQVAAEPLVQDPIAFDWGLDGGLWVVEMGDYPTGVDGNGKPGGRVRYLKDTDEDDKYDTSTTFLKDIGFRPT